MKGLIITDVDGTLVQDGTMNLNPEYYSVIRELTKRGMGVAVASGRQYESIRKLFEPVIDCIWCISESGGVIQNQTMKHMLSPIPKAFLKEIIGDIHQLDQADALICSATMAYVPEEGTAMYCWLKDSYGYHLESLNGWDNLPTEEIVKVSVYHPTDVLKVATPTFIPKWKERLHLCGAGEWWLDCIMAGVNKGSALQWLIQQLGVKANDVYAFGDNQNDIEMLQLAGHSYAVATARDEVKEISNQVISSYHDDGVLQEWKAILSTL